MAVAFGFIDGTTVATPAGPVPIETLSQGDVVWSWEPGDAAPVASKVVDVSVATTHHIVAIDLGDHVVRGTTPGTYFWDAFEESFRGAASLSTLAELLVGDADGLRPAAVLEVPERQVAPGVSVRHLELDRPGATYLADGALVRHREIT